MITGRLRLKDIIVSIAAQKKFRPSMVEKDYYSNIIINNIQTLLGDKWTVFLKGGAAISKAYLNQYRINHDLDFAIYAKDRAWSIRALRLLQTIGSIRNNMDIFLKATQLKCSNPYGKLYNNKTNFYFYVQYPSLFKDGEGNIKIDISLNQAPIEGPEYRIISHFYQDPLTAKDLIPQSRMLVLSLNELVAGKLSCAITRKDIRVEDYYDLGYIAKTGFDFYQDHFIKLFKQVLMNYLSHRNYQKNFGLSIEQIDQLKNKKEKFLFPYIRTDEEFSLHEVCENFNKVLSDKRFVLGFKDYYQALIDRPFEIIMKRLMRRMR